MSKVKKLLCLIFSTVVIAASACLFGGCNTATEVEFGEIDYQFSCHKNSPVNGVYSLSLSLGGGGGYVSVVARNQVELLVGTIEVALDLYASDEYPDSHEDMTRVARVTSDDLNFRDTLSIDYETGGKVRYYLAAMHFMVDNRRPKTYVAGSLKLGADGEFLSIGRQENK